MINGRRSHDQTSWATQTPRHDLYSNALPRQDSKSAATTNYMTKRQPSSSHVLAWLQRLPQQSTERPTPPTGRGGCEMPSRARPPRRSAKLGVTDKTARARLTHKTSLGAQKNPIGKSECYQLVADEICRRIVGTRGQPRALIDGTEGRRLRTILDIRHENRQRIFLKNNKI